MSDAGEGWPSTLEEAVQIVAAWLPDRARVASATDEELVAMHHGLGARVRRELGLWEGNGALLAACRASEADGASGVVLRALRNHLAGRPLHERVFAMKREYVCPRCGKTAQAVVFEQAELARAMTEPCGPCQHARSPAQTAKKMARRAHNDAARRRAEAAGALGDRFGVAIASAKPSHDGARLHLAERLFAEDGAFRTLWMEAFDTAPAAEHAAWLRGWSAPLVRIEAGVLTLQLASGARVAQPEIRVDETERAARASLYRARSGAYLLRVWTEVQRAIGDDVRWYTSADLRRLVPCEAPADEDALELLDRTWG